jgi:hypothetical protein
MRSLTLQQSESGISSCPVRGFATVANPQPPSSMIVLNHVDLTKTG